MLRRKRLLAILAVLVCWGTALSSQTEQTAERAAQNAAESWLPLLDSEKYEESWEALSPKTKERYSKRQWEAGMMGFRQPLGKLKSRTFGRAVYTKSLQGHPEHEGAIVRFDSVYENKESVVELVGVIHDKDGRWRVLLYTIPQ